MKRIVIIVALALMPLVGFSQSIFDQFEEMDNVASVIINKGMIDLFVTVADTDKSDPEAREFAEMARNIKGLKVFMTEDEAISNKMKQTVNTYLKKSSLEELMRVKDDETTVKFYIKKGKDENHVKELLMFVSGIKEAKIKDRDLESVLVTLTGDIDLRDVAMLTEKMDLPGDLKKVHKKE